MTNLKNTHYKSSIGFFNNVAQSIEVTNTVANPLTVILGTKTLDTGVALAFDTADVDVRATGLYEINVNATLEGTVAGDITVGLTRNGIVLADTLRTITVVAGALDEVVINTVKYLNTCCRGDDIIGVVAYSDATATADITSVSGNVIKLA